MNHQELIEQIGPIDIYLFDQILKGRFIPPMRILDAGCGGGRNVIHFLRNGFEVCGVDQSREAVEHVRELAGQLNLVLPPENFRIAAVDELPFDDASFDAVISSAVLHFASEEAHFDRMLKAMWRVLRPGGLFFSRLASTIGIEDRVRLINGRRYHLPDGSQRFLVDEAMLLDLAEQLNGRLIEPIKTSNVQGMRCMTTWIMRKE